MDNNLYQKTISQVLLCLISMALIPIITLGYTEKELAAARDFSIEGIDFSTTVSTLKKNYPDAFIVSEESDPARNMYLYRIRSTLYTDGIDVMFFFNKVGIIETTYLTERINNTFGSWDAIVSNLERKIGKANSSEGETDEDQATKVWKIPESNRLFVVEKRILSVHLSAINIELYSKYMALVKGKGEMGF